MSDPASQEDLLRGIHFVLNNAKQNIGSEDELSSLPNPQLLWKLGIVLGIMEAIEDAIAKELTLDKEIVVD